MGHAAFERAQEDKEALKNILDLNGEELVTKTTELKETILSKVENILSDNKIIKDLNEYKPDIINVILISLKNDISIPCFGEALNYFNSISSNSLSTKMIQAKRNFFGSHDIKIN